LIPFKDDNPTRTIPFVTIAIILLNVVVFFYEIFYPGGMDALVLNYGAIPRDLLTLHGMQPVGAFATVFTSMFMHGGLLHIGGNMLYLWIFGDNIEDALGHFRYIAFYLLAGLVAAYSNALADPRSVAPMIGASGAISGVLGAYLLLYPRARVNTLIFLGIFIQVVKLPALIVIGFWAIIQLASGLLMSGSAGQGGIAWFAHVGGFVFGLLAIKPMMMLAGRKTRRSGRNW
jgi:membrane associated rhomboid family serine protease